MSFFDKRMIPLARMNKPSHMRNYRRRYFFAKEKETSPVRFLKRDDRRHPFSQSAGGEPCRFHDVSYFPWFCKENLPLIKAVVLYEKLEIRINV